VRIEVAGFRSNTSPRLMDVADKWIDLEAHMDRIRKTVSPSEDHAEDHEAPEEV
jgi:uncharacterized LabA/DUF88 family protein